MTNLGRGIARIAIPIAIGVVGWVVLWNSGLNRVRYDTLWYASFTYQDAGMSREVAWARGWDLVGEFGSRELMASLPRAANGSWFDGWDDPKRARWVGIYAMRPAMPMLGALAVPVLGTDAPLAVSVLAVILLVVGAWVVLGPVAGAGATALFLVVSALNPLVSTWLIFLMPDGLGLALWLLALASAARYVVEGQRRWAIGSAAATLVLAFDRPSADLIPAILGAAAALALIARGPWRRFGVLTIATGAAAAIFTGWATILGYPSFRDFLQDLPTDHFVKPDVPHPVDYMLPYAQDLIGKTPGYLLGHPLVALALGLGIVGLLAARRWWIAPFILAIPAVPVLALAHPVATEVERTLAPLWLSIDLGVALLATGIAGRAGIPGAAPWRRARAEPTATE